MGSPFLLQVTVLTGPPLETQDTVCDEGSKVSSSLLSELTTCRTEKNNGDISSVRYLHSRCYKLLNTAAPGLDH